MNLYLSILKRFEKAIFIFEEALLIQPNKVFIL